MIKYVIMFMNDLRNCWRRFNADIMKLHMYQLWSGCEVKIQQLCSSSMDEPNISVSFHLSDYVQCRRERFTFLFEHGLYILALEHARMLILSNCLLLASINTIKINIWIVGSCMKYVCFVCSFIM